MPLNLDRNRLENLLAVGYRLNRSEDLGETLQVIADVAAELTQSQGSSILLFEDETQQLYFAAARSDHREHLMQIRVPIKSSVAGWVYEHGKPLNIPNAQIDPLIYRAVEQSLESSTRNLLAIPIAFRNKILGTLEVINKFDRQDYTPEDQSALDMLAGYAGTAIQIQRLLDDAANISQEQDELEQQKTDFIAITSHELRTPLGLVLGHATFLKELIQEDFYQKQLDVIVENSERLKEIVESLNQVKGFESGTARIRWQETDLNTLLQRVLNAFKQEAQERNINLGWTITEDPILLYCDAAKLTVAIENVVKNGLIFSDEGQEVHIGLHKLPGHAHISIADTGIGIPPEDQNRIFERFYQVEPHLTRTHGGMGLGLSVTKAIVESHGGHIWVESKIGEGSTFTILLPTKELPE